MSIAYDRTSDLWQAIIRYRDAYAEVEVEDAVEIGCDKRTYAEIQHELKMAEARLRVVFNRATGFFPLLVEEDTDNAHWELL